MQRLTIKSGNEKGPLAVSLKDVSGPLRLWVTLTFYAESQRLGQVASHGDRTDVHEGISVARSCCIVSRCLETSRNSLPVWSAPTQAARIRMPRRIRSMAPPRSPQKRPLLIFRTSRTSGTVHRRFAPCTRRFSRPPPETART